MYIQTIAVSQTLSITTLLLIGCLFTLSTAETYYVTPTSTTPCPQEEKPCFTLSQYATKPNHYFNTSNTTLILLPGNHLLQFDLEFTSIDETTLVPKSSSPVKVICNISNVNLRFENITHLHIHGLEMLGCMNNAVTNVNQFTLKSSTLQGQGRNGTGLDLYQVEFASIVNSSFISNTGRKYRKGGAINARYSNISIVNTVFNGNIAMGYYGYGGAMYVWDSTITIDGSTFTSNVAGSTGGAIHFEQSTFTIHQSTFTSNVAYNSAGAIFLERCTGVTQWCSFQNNTAKNAYYGSGGAVYIDGGNITVQNSSFLKNNATKGGAVFIGAYIYTEGAYTGGAVVIDNSSLLHNNADQGGAMYIDPAIGEFLNILIANTEFKFNAAQDNLFHVISSTLFLSGNITILNNAGAFYVIGSNVTFTGNITMMNNTVTMSQGSDGLSPSEAGGALTSFQSEIVFSGTTNIAHNNGGLGGGISLTESKLYNNGYTTIAYNNASNGGGVYAYHSELNLKGRNILKGNKALGKGGGIYAISTTTKVVGSFDSYYSQILSIIENDAEQGGGMYLESNSKLYHVKETFDFVEKIRFAENSADYGGALYISDDTNSTCAASPYTARSAASECFLQTLVLHSDTIYNAQSTFFANNTARKVGHTLYGGLLDRCKVSPLAEVVVYPYYIDYGPTPQALDAISYITTITNIPTHQIWLEISSQPVRVCFCRNNTPDCDYHLPTLHVRKGETFKIELVAVDIVNNTIANTTIYSSVSSQAGLDEGQAIQITTEKCTEMQYTITSPHDSEHIQIYAEGPCKNTGISAETLQVEFKTCPIGFTDTDSRCECNPQLSDYIAHCSLDNETLLKQDSSWISYINTTTQQGFVIYPHCPFHYCFPPTQQVWINLNTPHGADRQCALNRTGNLCGSCKDGLSLTLGSSRCMQCSNNWLTLLIVFAIAGIALVAFILVCNLTVAVGTINGLIFYANILTTNRATFFPFRTSNLFTIFISWINLDFGIETCFFHGLDAYVKTWLQLAFPLYIIFLVAMVIIACEYTTRLARLFTNTNPVATLATLILLSYVKSLRVIIAALSSAVLEYPDGSQKLVWLVDANIRYFEGKHIPLFLVALLILLIGFVYAFLLFFFQWLLRCTDRTALSWIGHARFLPFMDAYHAPYSVKHRYWTGLLILIRVFLYLIAGLNVNGDPSVNLLSISCVLISLLVFALLMPGSRVYKSWPLNALETSFILNLIIFSVATLYVRETGGNQVALAYTSTSVAFVTFLAFLAYHTYAFALPKKIRKKIRNRLNQSVFFSKLKLSKDVEEELDDAPVIVKESPENTKCTYSVIDGIPTAHKGEVNKNESTPPAKATGEAPKTISQASDNNILDHKTQFELQEMHMVATVQNGTEPNSSQLQTVVAVEIATEIS